jgi:hypothetical protein
MYLYIATTLEQTIITCRNVPFSNGNTFVECVFEMHIGNLKSSLLSIAKYTWINLGNPRWSPRSLIQYMFEIQNGNQRWPNTDEDHML